MKTDQEWEESARNFYRIMEKLDINDLKLLATTFECYPSYVGEVDKSWLMGALWTKFREWRRGTDDAQRLRAALNVLGMR